MSPIPSQARNYNRTLTSGRPQPDGEMGPQGVPLQQVPATGPARCSSATLIIQDETSSRLW